MLVIDGSAGEGGGQILRSALSLSLVTATPFRIVQIRAGRAKPGLRRQHLAAVRAAAEISGSQVQGDALGSRELEFHPGAVRGGRYRFAIGTAGSACLVLQTVLPPLLAAREPAQLELEGGTHNPAAPTWDFLARVYLPLLGRMGAEVQTELERPGFYPAGGGLFRVDVPAAPPLRPLELLARGAPRGRRARALVAHLDPEIGERELRVLRAELPGLHDAAVIAADEARGRGNALSVELAYEHVTELFSAIGERGVRAELVAQRLASEVRSYLQSDAPVGPHLADQLVLPCALAGGGVFRTLLLTRHTRTNAEIVQRFLPVRVRCTSEEGGAARVEVSAR